MTGEINIIDAIGHRDLFRPYLQDAKGSIHTWRRWLVALKVIYGLPITKPWEKRLVRRCTGRDPDKLPAKGFNTVLLLCGRRSGKSKIAGLIGAYEASLAGNEKHLSPGEIGVVSICSPTKDQSRVIEGYCRGAFDSPMLNSHASPLTTKGFSFDDVLVRTVCGDFRTVRGYSQLAVIVDEICFFANSDENLTKIRTKGDAELIRSIKPSLLTTHGRLVCISTKYRPAGWAYEQWKKYFGKDTDRILIWDASSRRMNPTLSQEEIDAAIAEDPIAARCEYLNRWRRDVESFVSRSEVEACVVPNRSELLPCPGVAYVGYADVSGGRSDPFALAIGHKAPGTRKVVIDLVREWKAPKRKGSALNPMEVIKQMAAILKTYGLKSTYGDDFAAEFNAQTFKSNGIEYVWGEKRKAQLFLEMLSVLNSRELELLDNPELISQLSLLERRTSQGGHDVVGHPKGNKLHDDMANCVAGVAVFASQTKNKRRAGGLLRRKDKNDDWKMLENRRLFGRLAAAQHERR
ncbi:hypothetical protein [Petrachloros mirabilis]